MSKFDLVIHGGTVVTASDSFAADVGIKDGIIQEVSRHIDIVGVESIDASGLLVLPGGIDSHVHLAQHTHDGTVMADDYESGSRSAVAGGTTSIITFALQDKGVSLRRTLEIYHAKADARSYCDYGFHVIVTDPNAEVLQSEFPALVTEGYPSFKIFMTYDDLVLRDRQILDVLEKARECGAFVMVHCEGHDAIRFLTERLEKSGCKTPYYHASSRPEAVEREAAHRVISYAELLDVPIMIVHVSGRETVEQLRWARKRGLKIYGETCPQYISLTADDLKNVQSPEEGGKYVCSPPPRDRESWDAIWEGLREGLFQTFSSDHSPFYFGGENGKTSPRALTSFRWVPNGVPGVETRLPIFFSKGVVEGRISVNDFVALTSTNHAKLYGLYPQKGTIAPGFDADIALWDPSRKTVIRQSILHHGADYTPYEGMEVTGWPIMTILRGKVVYRDGKIIGRPGDGRFVARRKTASGL
ncbi:dihydropyrimidinase [Gluconacetobacter sp. Hr-1-5]|uniref:dihydropyrimidinase n=1 Tax=Gluconacetobacter sp. Hr-1-5 TaxID=3395370 RepID=UPI003B515A9B